MSMQYCPICEDTVDTDFEVEHLLHSEEFNSALEDWKQTTDNPGYMPPETYQERFGHELS